MTSPTKPNLELISKATREENNELKTLLEARNNELKRLRDDYRKQSEALHQARTELYRLKNAGKFKEEIKTLVS